jgi:betaine-aldehyde dehydrogenase
VANVESGETMTSIEHHDRPARINRQLMVIGGRSVESSDGRYIDVENPANRTTIGQVPRATADDIDSAVRGAATAFEAWRLVVPRDRGRLLSNIADALEAELETLGRTVAQETGNAIRTQARPEVKSAIDVFRYFGGVTSELKGETVPLGEHVLSYTRREPIGTVGGIVPWNAPVVLGSLKIAMSIAAGNTLVLKAAEEAPLGLVRVAQLCNEHLPPGVVNLVTGYGEECGAALANHPLVRKLSFTGSTEVGRLIMHAAADRIAPVSLELGGKSPAIVFPDADDDCTVDGVISGMRFTRQGQSCTAGSRLFLHRSIFESFLGKLAARLEQLRIGDPLDEATDMGAIINRKQFDRVCEYIEDGLSQQEGRVVLGGLPPATGPLAEGYFVEPTVFAGVHSDWRIAREEIFGPVMVAIPWDDRDDAIRMANDSHYGLAAYIWTHDIGTALTTAHAIESGWIQINQGLGQSPGHSYGGFKQSGIGREYSLEGMLDSFTQRKSVTVNLRY